MDNTIVIKQYKTKSDAFNVTGVNVIGGINFSTVIRALTMDQLRAEISRLIEEYNMSKNYTIGVTESQRIQVIIKG